MCSTQLSFFYIHLKWFVVRVPTWALACDVQTHQDLSLPVSSSRKHKPHWQTDWCHWYLRVGIWKVWEKTALSSCKYDFRLAFVSSWYKFIKFSKPVFLLSHRLVLYRPYSHVFCCSWFPASMYFLSGLLLIFQNTLWMSCQLFYNVTNLDSAQQLLFFFYL